MNPTAPNGAGRVQLPPARDLQSVVRDAEAAVAVGDSGRALALLRELTAWVSLRLNPTERERAAGMIRDPAMLGKLVSLPVTLQRVIGENGVPVHHYAKGDVTVAPLLLVMPVGNLQVSPIQLSMGADPLGDMLPLLDARMVLPRERMSPRVMDVVEGKASTGGT